MGKVIKGSLESPERYMVSIPVFVAPDDVRYEHAAGGDDDFNASSGFEPLLDEIAEAAAPPVTAPPPVDFEAMAAQAQALIDDAERSADRLIEEARERARKLIDDAHVSAATIAGEAREKGHAEGTASGSQAAESEMASMLATMRELLESVRRERQTLIRAAEPELVRLAVGIAERVLHQQIALDDGVVVEMAKAAITRIVEREKITVRVNPADVDRMREHRDELLALGDVKTMLVIEDQRVDRGGVIIETDGGSIDAKISTQLAEVRKILHIADDIVVEPAPVENREDAESAAARAS